MRYQHEPSGIAIQIPYELFELLASDPAADTCTPEELAATIIRAHYEKGD